MADAFNRRDMAGLVALSSADGRYEDRRKGLREELEGPARQKAAHSALQTVPSGWRMEVEPIAIRGAHLSLTREYYRDTDDADQPIAVELLRVTQVGDDSLTHDTVILDPDDINAAFAELDNRYLAGEAGSQGSQLRCAVKVQVKIPLLGGKFEKSIGDNLAAEGIPELQRFTAKWIAENALTKAAAAPPVRRRPVSGCAPGFPGPAKTPPPRAR